MAVCAIGSMGLRLLTNGANRGSLLTSRFCVARALSNF